MSNTKYSKDVPGTRANWGRAARFDRTDGLIGITQWRPKESGFTDRVLLNRAQVDALLKFIGAKRQPRSATGNSGG